MRHGWARTDVQPQWLTCAKGAAYLACTTGSLLG